MQNNPYRTSEFKMPKRIKKCRCNDISECDFHAIVSDISFCIPYIAVFLLWIGPAIFIKAQTHPSYVAKDMDTLAFYWLIIPVMLVCAYFVIRVIVNIYKNSFYHTEE